METLFTLAQNFVGQFGSPDEWWAHTHLVVCRDNGKGDPVPGDIEILGTAQEASQAGVPGDIQSKMAEMLKEHISKGEVYAYAAVTDPQRRHWELAAIPCSTRATSALA